MRRVRVELGFECDEDMDKMPGAEGGRACTRCGHVVRDLTALPQAEALRMLREAQARGEQVCVWQLRDRQGVTLFRDSAPGELQLARRDAHGAAGRLGGGAAPHV
jgi:hypothetical protein